MSTAYVRFCKLHGEWPIYIDELLCPKCPGLTDVAKQTFEDTYSELTNLKDAFTRLREDRDMHSEMRKENLALALKQFEENLELQKKINSLLQRFV